MNRQQINMAQQLFYELDKLQSLLDIVTSGKGLAVSIGGTWQGDDVATHVQRPLRDYYQQKIQAINTQLKQIGWTQQ